MRYLILLLLILNLNLIYATCSEGEIDINNAGQGELEELTGIGEVKAQAIIDSRPFDSVDDLIEVYGIGEVTLKKIEEQGLACVERDSKNKKDTKDDPGEEIVSDFETYSEVIPENISVEKEKIVLTAEKKDIKKEENSSNIERIETIYSLAGFCCLLGVLYFSRWIKSKKYSQNELG